MPLAIEMQAIFGKKTQVGEKTFFIGIGNYRTNFRCYRPHIAIEFTEALLPHLCSFTF